jgi:hypothetical protein
MADSAPQKMIHEWTAILGEMIERLGTGWGYRSCWEIIGRWTMLGDKEMPAGLGDKWRCRRGWEINGDAGGVGR